MAQYPRIDFGFDNYDEAFVLLDLIDAEFRSDPTSVQCFDALVVERVRRCVELRKRSERKGDVPPLLTNGRARAQSSPPSPGDVQRAHLAEFGK